MATIQVKAKIGNTIHPKYGALVEGQEMTIDEADFGDEIFERSSLVLSSVVPRAAGGGSKEKKIIE